MIQPIRNYHLLFVWAMKLICRHMFLAVFWSEQRLQFFRSNLLGSGFCKLEHQHRMNTYCVTEGCAAWPMSAKFKRTYSSVAWCMSAKFKRTYSSVEWCVSSRNHPRMTSELAKHAFTNNKSSQMADNAGDVAWWNDELESGCWLEWLLLACFSHPFCQSLLLYHIISYYII